MDFSYESLNLFLNEYSYRYVRFAINYIGDKAAAEDFVMESVMTFWSHRQSLPDDTNVPAYVLTVLKNKCIDYLRHINVVEKYGQQRRDVQEWSLKNRISSLEALDPSEVFSKEIVDIVSKTVSSFSEDTRRVFLMSRKEGLKNIEIAKCLGISEKGVEYHITKANKMLKLALSDYLTVFVALFYLL